MKVLMGIFIVSRRFEGVQFRPEIGIWVFTGIQPSLTHITSSIKTFSGRIDGMCISFRFVCQEWIILDVDVTGRGTA
jgi:hypothetical protein